MSVSLPEIDSYCYDNNYGVHALRVDVGPLTVWFSYKTPIAFKVDGHDRVVRDNIWRTTTGRHINAVDGADKDLERSNRSEWKRRRDARVSSEEFERLWKELVEPLFAASEASPCS